jgi:hypothetical protein
VTAAVFGMPGGRHRNGRLSAPRTALSSRRRGGSGQPRTRTKPASQRAAPAAVAASAASSRWAMRSATQSPTEQSGLVAMARIQARTASSGAGREPSSISRWRSRAAFPAAALASGADQPGKPQPSSPCARNRAGQASASCAANQPT